MARITFHGAAETVTGSKYLLENSHARLLIDCGLFQGLKELRLKNWTPLPVDPRGIDAVVLTHAHIDHTGYLPRLVKLGFRGRVYCTPPTLQLTELLLLDAAKNQESDAAYLNRKRLSKHKPAVPLFDSADVEQALRLFQAVPRQTWFSPGEPFWMRYHDAGHLLGSAMIEVEIRDRDPPLRLLFSGDVGRYESPLYHNPAPPPPCDVLICESTYGDRDHPAVNVADQLAEVVRSSIDRGGVLLVAAFAVGRAQQLIYLLQILIAQGRLPRIPIYLDSPMATEASRIYALFAAEHDLSEALVAGVVQSISADNVRLVKTQQESKRLNSVDHPAIIISSSGMMEGGRILFHLQQRLPDPRNTVVLGGFMAEGTRGRMLQRGAKWLRIHQQDVPVRARVVEMSALSCHADRGELFRWLEPLPRPRQVFLTHGEKQSAEALATALRSRRGWQVAVPHLGQSFDLERAG
jgi:metallo-beta-lactamase family protein